MFSRLLPMLGAAMLALSCAGLVSADTGTGNVASNSLATVQASNLTTAPAVSAVTPDGTVTSSTPASIVGDGGNTVSDSIASVQAGGANTATGSTGTGQLSTTSAKPSASATTPVQNASAAATAKAGNATNSVSKGLVTVQAGKVSVKNATVKTSPAPSGSKIVLPKATVPKLRHVTVGNPTVSASPQVTQHVSTNLRSATVRPAVSVAPNTSAASGNVAQTQSGGSVGLAQNQGDTAHHSFGTVQGGALTASPALAFMSPSTELALMLGGSSGVDGGTPNSASDSIGTAQIGSGNETDPSIGTVQVGSLHVGPTAALSSPDGNTGLGGSTGLAGGNNQANNSDGTVQIGGNTANRSLGTAQVAPVNENEQGTLGGTPVGGGSVTAPQQIGSGTIGNTATSSAGTVQVGGGNSATGTGGTVQVGGGSPSGPVTVTTPTPTGGTTPPSETGTPPAGSTPGTPAAPREPGASGTTAPAARTPLSGSAVSSAAAGAAKQANAKSNASTKSATPSRSAVAGVSKATNKAAAGTPSSSPSGTSILGQTLPFTGLTLTLIALLGLGLLGVGVAVRRFAATATTTTTG